LPNIAIVSVVIVLVVVVSITVDAVAIAVVVVAILVQMVQSLVTSGPVQMRMQGSASFCYDNLQRLVIVCFKFYDKLLVHAM